MKTVRNAIFMILVAALLIGCMSGCSKNGVKTVMRETISDTQEESIDADTSSIEAKTTLGKNESEQILDENLKETMISELNEFFAILYAEKLELDPGFIYSDNEQENSAKDE